jgi:Large ribosomal RNA subunit accumulation protein YceD
VSTPDRLRLRDASVRLDSMPVAGRDVVVSPTADERAAVASQLGISTVERLDVKLHAVRFRGGIRVTGRLTAQVTQPSVVTLEPLTQEIGEPVDRIFLPGGQKDYAGPANAEIFVDLEGDDVPDHFEGNEADLSDLIVETLALAVDLYPREPDVSLEDTGFKPDLNKTSPFAALKALKPKED